MRATLKKRTDFKKIFRHGRAIKEGGVVFRYLPNMLSRHRLAFVVSKRVARTAVARNKIKRRLREFSREYHRTRNGLDGVFVATEKIKDMNAALLRENIRTIFAKAEKIKK